MWLFGTEPSVRPAAPAATATKIPAYSVTIREENGRQLEIRLLDALPPSVKPTNVKTFMVMGASGAGKTSWIQALVNCVRGVNYEDPFRYKIKVEHNETQLGSAFSQTIAVCEYWINVSGQGHSKDVKDVKDGRSEEWIRLVDTPGFVDTRATLEREKVIHQQIMGYIRKLDALHGILLVMRSGDNKLSITQRYLINAIMTMFAKGPDTEDHFYVMVTHADSSRPACLETLKAEGCPTKHGVSEKQVFKFNNGALFAAPATAAQLKAMSPQQQFDEENFSREFKISSFGMKLFLAGISTMTPMELRLTWEVIDARSAFEDAKHALMAKLNASLSKQVELASILVDMEAKRHDIDRFGKYESTFILDDYKEETLPDEDINTVCCLCHHVCHEHCGIKLTTEKHGCLAMDKSGQCKVCPKRCHWSAHAFTGVKFTPCKKTVVRVDEVTKGLHDESQSSLTAYEILSKERASELEEAKRDTLDAVKQVCELLNQLQSKAWRDVNLSWKQYVRELISNQKYRRTAGYMQRVKGLEDVLALDSLSDPSRGSQVEKVEDEAEVLQEFRSVSVIESLVESMRNAYVPGEDIVEKLQQAATLHYDEETPEHQEHAGHHSHVNHVSDVSDVSDTKEVKDDMPSSTDQLRIDTSSKAKAGADLNWDDDAELSELDDFDEEFGQKLPLLSSERS